MPRYKLATATTAALLASTALASTAALAGVQHGHNGSFTTSNFYTHSTSWGNGTNNSTGFTPQQLISMGGFDAKTGLPAGATLNHVDITVTGSLNGSVKITNIGTANTGTYTTQLLNTVKVFTPGSSTKQINQLGTPPLANQIVQPGSTSPTQTESASTTTSIAITSASPNLSNYLGNWAATAGDYGSYTLGGSAEGKTTYTDVGTVTIAAKYFYHYVTTTTPSTPVPEPGALGLLGAGLAGLGVMRRRRKA